MKPCRTCGLTKSPESFYVHSAMKDGRLNHCKDCVKARVAAHRAENIDRVRSYDRERGRTEERKEKARKYAKSNPELTTRIKQEWAERNRHKVRAQRSVNNAVRDGRLFKEPCFCGETDVEGHHFDYSKPLKVVWLCDTHHKQVHRRYEGKLLLTTAHQKPETVA